jgi:hypothetical protein
MAERNEPTRRQIDVAIEGAKEMPEVSRGAGRVVGLEPGTHGRKPTTSK